MALVIVDVDGTLLRGPSSEILFFAHLFSGRKLGPGQILDAAMFVPRWAGRFGVHTFKKNKAYLTGLDVEDIAVIARNFVATELVGRRLRPAVVDRLRQHRAAGDTIALLTGTLDVLAEPLANQLGAAFCCATRCARADGVFVADPPVRHPFGADKVALAAALCSEAGTALADCWAYADAIHDLLLLRAVGRPVVVNPDRRLAGIARTEKWEVLDGLD